MKSLFLYFLSWLKNNIFADKLLEDDDRVLFFACRVLGTTYEAFLPKWAFWNQLMFVRK